MNRWGIPESLENEVRARDTHCIYCRDKLTSSVDADGCRKKIATWEHIINDATIITQKNIALCCNSCNASKGSKALTDWLDSDYCRRKKINRNNVAEIVKTNLV